MMVQGHVIRHFMVLFVATLTAQLSSLAYKAHVQDFSFSSQLLPSLLFLSALTIPALLIGLLIGPKVDIGPFQNRTQTNLFHIKHAVGFTVISSILLGLFLLALRWALESYLPAEIKPYGFRGFIGGTMVSISAGIGEEIWFRFGLMTLALWLTKKLCKLDSLTNKHVLLIIVGVGLLFGLAHLPQLTSVGADTQFAVCATILGNVSVSILFGWCFWRYGLIYAVLAHIGVDMVLHAFPALL